MGILNALEQRLAMGATGATDDKWYQPGGMFYGGGGGLSTKSGSAVSELNAMRLAVVWCCIKILSEDSASLPVHLYRRLKGGGKERAVDHPLYTLMHDQPNSEMNAMQFRETFASHLLAWGNGYAEKEFGRGWLGRDRVVALWPIAPHRVTPRRDQNKQLIYRITMPGGLAPVDLPRRQILHVPGLSYDGIIGYSPIAAAREAIGLGMTLEEYSARYFGNGSHPGIVVSHPGKLGEVAHKTLENSLINSISGLGKAHRLMLLQEAMEVKTIGFDNKDSQFIEAKKYSNIDIGTRIYRIPPHMYGEMDRATYSNIEQQALDYVSKALRPWLVRLEQAWNMSLITDNERGELFYEHLVDGLLRGELKARYDAYAVARSNGWMNGDEIREIENMNPMEGDQGKIYMIQGAMVPITDAGAKWKQVKKVQGDGK